MFARNIYRAFTLCEGAIITLTLPRYSKNESPPEEALTCKPVSPSWVSTLNTAPTGEVTLREIKIAP